jgi:hypothetical protein
MTPRRRPSGWATGVARSSPSRPGRPVPTAGCRVLHGCHAGGLDGGRDRDEGHARVQAARGRLAQGLVPVMRCGGRSGQAQGGATGGQRAVERHLAEQAGGGDPVAAVDPGSVPPGPARQVQRAGAPAQQSAGTLWWFPASSGRGAPGAGPPGPTRRAAGDGGAAARPGALRRADLRRHRAAGRGRRHAGDDDPGAEEPPLTARSRRPPRVGATHRRPRGAQAGTSAACAGRGRAPRGATQR